jgi:hypothetical protein
MMGTDVDLMTSTSLASSWLSVDEHSDAANHVTPGLASIGSGARMHPGGWADQRAAMRSVVLATLRIRAGTWRELGDPTGSPGYLVLCQHRIG